MEIKNKWHFIWIAPLALAGLAFCIYLGGQVVRLLWNWLLPPLFGWHEITFWQALGILLLCRILFGGRGFSSGSGPKKQIGSEIGSKIADRIADRVAEKWDQMSPEERERFRQRLRDKIGFDPSGGGANAAP